jgi:uncharacterized protein
MYPMRKTPQAVPKDTRRIQVRRSGVHGKGVFALQPIAAGSRLIEYTGEVIGWPEALERHPHDPDDPNHTFYFSLDDGTHVIDAKVGGNASRWINHACDPNCKAEEGEGRVFIHALRDLRLRPGHRRALHAQAQEGLRLPLRQPELPRHHAGP